MENNELLQYALEHGIIDLLSVREMAEMEKRKELLKKYPHSIWQGKNGAWYTKLPSGGMKRRKTKQEIEDIAISYVESQDINPTWGEVFREWNDRRVELKKITMASSLRYEKMFNRHFKDFGERRVKDTKALEIVDFLEEQIPKYNLSAKAFSNLKTVMRGMLRRAKKRNLIDYTADSVLQEIETSETEFHRTYKDDREEVFDEEETEQMIDYLTQHLDTLNMAILLMFVTGIRVGEAVALKHEDIGEGYITIRRTETTYKMDGKPVYDVRESPKTAAGFRKAVIPPGYEWLLRKIKLINPFGEWVFAKNRRRERVRSVQARLYRVCDKVGIPRRSSHKIRKTYVSILLDNHVDARTVIDQVGHSNIAISEIHYHRNRKTIEAKQAVIGSIPDFQTM